MNTSENIIPTILIPKLADLELINDGESYKVLYQDRAFIIGRLLHQLISQLRNGVPFEKIVSAVFEKEHYEIGEEELGVLLEEKIEKFNALLEDNSTKRRSSYILLKTKIANDRVVGLFSNSLSFLFQKNIFYPAIVLIIAAQIFYLLYGPEVSDLFSVNVLSTKKVIGAYVLAILILLFHEFGHASAAKWFGVQPKEIGFGFYLIFPVLYADVTAIWRLDKYKRIVVNVGGIYFQGLIHLFIIFYLCFCSGFNSTLTIVFTFLYKINIAVILYSLTPFFRNDGYWIYSDLFNLPNLNKRANEYPKDLFLNFKNSPLFKSIKPFDFKAFFAQLPLLVYSVANYIVMTFFFFLFFKILWNTSIGIIDTLSSSNQSVNMLQIVFKIIFLIVSVCLMLYNYRTLAVKIYKSLRTIKLIKP